MAGKATPLGKKTKRGNTVPKTGALQVKKARNGERGMKARAEDPACPTPMKSVEPIQRPDRDQDTASKGDRIKEEIPEALAYFLDVYGRLGRGRG